MDWIWPATLYHPGYRFPAGLENWWQGAVAALIAPRAVIINTVAVSPTPNIETCGEPCGLKVTLWPDCACGLILHWIRHMDWPNATCSAYRAGLVEHQWCNGICRYLFQGMETKETIPKCCLQATLMKLWYKRKTPQDCSHLWGRKA